MDWKDLVFGTPTPEPPAQPATSQPTADASAAADPAAPAPAAPPSVKVGDTVRHVYDGPAGEIEQIGQVAYVDTDTPDQTPRVAVLWYAGRSGPIPLEDLEVLS